MLFELLPTSSASTTETYQNHQFVWSHLSHLIISDLTCWQMFTLIFTYFHTIPVKSAANSLDRLHAPTTEPTAPWMCLEWLAHCCSIQLVGKQWWVHVVNRIQFADISTSWSWYGHGIVMVIPVISCSFYCMIYCRYWTLRSEKPGYPRMVIWVLDAVVMAASFGAGFKLVQALLILGILEEWPGSGKSESLKLLNQYRTCIYDK